MSLKSRNHTLALGRPSDLVDEPAQRRRLLPRCTRLLVAAGCVRHRAGRPAGHQWLAITKTVLPWKLTSPGALALASQRCWRVDPPGDHRQLRRPNLVTICVAVVASPPGRSTNDTPWLNRNAIRMFATRLAPSLSFTGSITPTGTRAARGDTASVNFFSVWSAASHPSCRARVVLDLLQRHHIRRRQLYQVAPAGRTWPAVAGPGLHVVGPPPARRRSAWCGSGWSCPRTRCRACRLQHVAPNGCSPRPSCTRELAPSWPPGTHLENGSALAQPPLSVVVAE